MSDISNNGYKLSRQELLTTSDIGRQRYVDSLLRSVKTVERKFRQALRRGQVYANRETQSEKLYMAWGLLEQAGVMPQLADIEKPDEISVYSLSEGAKISIPYTASRSKRKFTLEAVVHLDNIEIETWEV